MARASAREPACPTPVAGRQSVEGARDRTLPLGRAWPGRKAAPGLRVRPHATSPPQKESHTRRTRLHKHTPACAHSLCLIQSLSHSITQSLSHSCVVHTRSVPHTSLHKTELPRVRGAAISLVSRGRVLPVLPPSSVPIDVTTMTATSTSTLFSQEDTVFSSHVDLLPGELKGALRARGLADPGVLRAYPRASWDQLEYVRGSTASTQMGGGTTGVTVIGDTPENLALVSPPPTSATPPTSSTTLHRTIPTLQSKVQSTLCEARTITDNTAVTTATQPYALHVPKDPTTTTTAPAIAARRKRTDKMPKTKMLRSSLPSDKLVKKSTGSYEQRRFWKSMENPI